MKEKQRFSLFLGCIIPDRYPFIERATRKVFEKLGIELMEMEGASCCPAPGVFRGFDIDSWLILGARNLTIAEENGTDIALMCNGCYGSLLEVNHILKTDPEKRAMVNTHLQKIGREFKGTVEVRHIVGILYNDFGVDKLKQRTKYGRKEKLDLNVAVHYGCHLVKPAESRPWNCDIEEPRFLDELVEVTGVKSLDYRDKYMCCGAGGGVRSAFKDVSLDMTKEKLNNMRKVGAEAIITACPFCHLQFDLGQVEINSTSKDLVNPNFNIPVIYYTQLLGLALGFTAEEVGLIKSKDLAGVPPFTSMESFLNKIGEKVGV